MTQKKCLILLATGSEEMEAVTVLDIVKRGDIDIVTCSIGDKQVTCSRDVKLVCEKSVGDIKDELYDMVIIPGGMPGVDNIGNSKEAKKIVSHHAEKGKYVAAICAAPMAVKKYDMFKGKKATSYPTLMDSVKDHFEWVNEKVVVDGMLITSQGPATAIYFALQIVETLVGKEKRDSIAKDLLLTV